MNFMDFFPVIMVITMVFIALYLWMKDNYETKKRLDELEKMNDKKEYKGITRKNYKEKR